MRKKLITLIICCVLLSACYSSPVNETPSSLGAPDYARLFLIAQNLASKDMGKNIEGLTALIGPERTAQFVQWYNTVILGIKAAQAITRKTAPRDLRVTAVINQYHATP